VDLWAVSLVPRSPWHVGESPGDVDTGAVFPPADTLYGALCHAWRALFGVEALEGLLSVFQGGAPPFRITSLFPEAEGVRHYPAPLAGVPMGTAHWLPEPVFTALARGEGTDMPSSSRDFFLRSQVAHAAIGREDRAATPYEVGVVSLRPGDSLFALVLAGEDVLGRLQGAFAYAAETGIGGQRSRGLGRFERPVWTRVRLDVPAKAPHFVTLSPYMPSLAEYRRLSGVWRLRLRRGWISSPEGSGLLERAVRQCVEGSWFEEDGQEGILAEVTPPSFRHHPVFRYGLAFKVPWLGVGG